MRTPWIVALMLVAFGPGSGVAQEAGDSIQKRLREANRRVLEAI